MSDTERLEAAADKMEAWAFEAQDSWTTLTTEQVRQIAMARAEAGLLRAVTAAHLCHYDEAPLHRAALAVADAVLGVPASPKGADMTERRGDVVKPDPLCFGCRQVGPQHRPKHAPRESN